MPRYYLNVSDGLHEFRDPEGINLQRSSDIADEAETLLRLLAYEQRHNLKTKVMKALVQDDEGRNVFRGTLVAGRGEALFSGRRL